VAEEAAGEVAGEGADEVSEVCDVLWSHRSLVYTLFDFYAALGTSDDIFSIKFNSFTQFVNDFGLSDKRSSHCKAKDFDQLFISIDSSNIGNKIVEKHNKKKCLNRREFLQVLVSVAVMRYVLPGELEDVSTAVQCLMVEDLGPLADPHVFRPPNLSREALCYNEDVDGVLRRHEGALRMLYARCCVLEGVSMEGGLSNKLVSFPSWKRFLNAFKLIDVDLTERDATLCFVWARMHTVDEQNDKSRSKWTHLSFEDWLEALCRLSVLKALPTDEEIGEAGCDDCGTYMLQLLRDDAAAYNKMLTTRDSPWGTVKPTLQPVARCVEHVIHMIIVHCHGGLTRHTATSGWDVTERQVANMLMVTK
jgi:hypothetical protein